MAPYKQMGIIKHCVKAKVVVRVGNSQHCREDRVMELSQSFEKGDI